MYDAEQQNLIFKSVDVPFMENMKAMEQIKAYEETHKMQSMFNLKSKKSAFAVAGLGNAMKDKLNEL